MCPYVWFGVMPTDCRLIFFILHAVSFPSTFCKRTSFQSAFFNKHADTPLWIWETGCYPLSTDNVVWAFDLLDLIVLGWQGILISPPAHIKRHVKPSSLRLGVAPCLRSFDKIWAKKTKILKKRGRKETFHHCRWFVHFDLFHRFHHTHKWVVKKCQLSGAFKMKNSRGPWSNGCK